MGLTILCIIFFTFGLNDEIFCIILSLPHNIVMDLNNVMGFKIWTRFLVRMLAPLHTWDWEPIPSHFKNSHRWKRRSRSKFVSHYAWGTNIVYDCKMDVNTTWIPTLSSNWSCFMVTWTTFKNRVLEVSLPQNQETMALRMLTTIDLFCSIVCEDPHEHEFIEIAFGWGPSHIRPHTKLEGVWPHYMILEVCWDGLWTLSFGLSQFHGHRSWLVCEVALRDSEYGGNYTKTWNRLTSWKG